MWTESEIRTCHDKNNWIVIRYTLRFFFFVKAYCFYADQSYNEISNTEDQT